MQLKEKLIQLVEYKRWANQLTFAALGELPEKELVKPRPTRFGNMLHTLNHVYVIDDIFKAHLLSQPHIYTERNTESPPPLEVLEQKQEQMDLWYLDYIQTLKEGALSDVIEFRFVDGKEGKMTLSDIILHVVNHGTYHRGFVADMMYQVPATPPANDLTVYLQNL